MAATRACIRVAHAGPILTLFASYTGFAARTAVILVGLQVNALANLRGGTAGTNRWCRSWTGTPPPGPAGCAGRAAAATANQDVGAAELICARGCIGKAGVSLAALLAGTALTLPRAGASGRSGLGLTTVPGEPAHPRDRGYRTTHKRASEQPQCPAPRNSAVS